ncbi:hypothetical protein [Actinomadura gamaensis]|uniref:Uncharacterized protein n=1 Tax=Actinomadura gamaensis TaxID=1763541 RepID=A0ABV9U1A6_9ACTN
MADESIDRVNVEVGGDLSGQVVIGDRNKLVAGLEKRAANVSDPAELRALIAQLRAALAAQPGDVAAEGSERLADLEDALSAERPDPGRMRRVRDWFRERAPELAGAVGKIIVSPLATTLATAAGDDLAAEARRHLGA